MDLEQIQSRLDFIEEVSGDSEAAHSCEDELYKAFIQWIAEDWSGGLSEKARLVLTSSQIDFCRWCA